MIDLDTPTLANGIIGITYLAISIAVGRGLLLSGQWRHNPLGLATAAIFFTCAVGHASHSLHLPDSSAHVGHEPFSADGDVFDGQFFAAAWDVLTASVGVWYWTMRGRFPALVRGAAVFEDLRLREAAEQTLRASEERYRGIVETTTDGVVLIDDQGRIGYANAQFADMLGQREQDLLTASVLDAAVPADRERLRQGLEQAGGGAAWRDEVLLRHVDGRDVCAQIALTTRRCALGRCGPTGHPNAVLAIVSDITERKKVEAQLRQARRLDALGQLAGGVAHDFNNLLTVIDGHVALVQATADLGEGAHRDLSAVRDAAARATTLTSQLLAFSRSAEARPQVVDLNDLVLGLRDMLRRLIQEDIDLTVHVADRPATVQADPSQLEQVVINLALNGRDAMPEGGALSIHVDHVSLDADRAAVVGAAAPGDHALLTVADTGVGMTEPVRTRAFEPFFTTKEQGKGTGLGLSTVYGVVRQCAGAVQVESEAGAGSIFRVYLPAAASSPTTRVGDKIESDQLARGDETVLLAEDDPAVRDLAMRILCSAGYHVLPAADGREALTLARLHPEIDLLVTDLIMPGCNGRQLADGVLRNIPGVGVLFTSAYSRGILADRRDDPNVPYLAKPFTPATLTSRVRHALDGRRDAPAARQASTVPGSPPREQDESTRNVGT